jgi:hypothetical protein
LPLIISVQDSERSGMIASHDDVTSRKKSAVYTGALLDRLQVLNSDRPHGIHGMVEAQHCGLSMPTNSSETCWSSQAGKHNFGLSELLLCIHWRDTKRACIPTSVEHENFYVNNYIDWDQYNTTFCEMASG